MDTNTLNILLYILIIGIPLIAQIRIKMSYNSYKKVLNSNNLSGFEVARKILDANGLSNIYIVETPGELTDHYDPTRKTIRLSTDIFKGDSIAALSVAAHECGHAIQDKENYMPLRIRSLLVPAVNFVSSISWYIIIFGIIAQMFNVLLIGIGFISISLIFQLVTLPVEFDASKRAKEELNRLNLISDKENNGVSSMLHSAAMTYVAAVLTSVLQIIRLLTMYSNNKRR